MEIVKVRHLKQVMEFLKNPKNILTENPSLWNILEENTEESIDFKEVNGQRLARRATEVAVAGCHNILYLGPPGSGKSMIAQRIPTIMPSLSRKEQLEISKIYSVCGMLPPGKALSSATPHHHSPCHGRRRQISKTWRNLPCIQRGSLFG